MIPELSGTAPRLVESLAHVARKHPVDKKLVVSSTISSGRELLRRVILGGTGWIGFDVTAPRPLALRLARAEMDRSGLGILDMFEAQALLDDAIDHVRMSEHFDSGRFRDGVGFRERVYWAVGSLRMADMSSADMYHRRSALSDLTRDLLARVLQEYEKLLTERRKVDTAGVLSLALQVLEAEGAVLPESLDENHVFLLPGLGTRGLMGRLIKSLEARGGKVLETDPVLGRKIPKDRLWRSPKEPAPRSYLGFREQLPDSTEVGNVEFFRSASVYDELREVLRRVLREKIPWDMVEIVTPDPTAYGSVLHELSIRLGIPVTYAVGLPIERTRTGRVLRTYLDWVEGGFQAGPIRRLLEAGDLTPPRSRGRHAAAALARRFRSLRIGWGRKRYRTQIREALEGVEHLTRRTTESERDFSKRRDRSRRELEALRAILFPALRVTPAVPDRMNQGDTRVSPAEIARGLRMFLRRVPRGKGLDLNAREQVEGILKRVEATLGRRLHFAGALTVLRRHLRLRVRTRRVANEADAGTAPWLSEGGHLHFSDLENGGFTGRRAVFIVGLDDDRIPGFSGQDPMLPDIDRRVLSEELPTSTEVLDDKAFEFSALFARLHGDVTLSYSAWDPSSARSVGASSLLLSALRMKCNDPGLTLDDLDKVLGRLACAVPEFETSALDIEDRWMFELGQRSSAMLFGPDAVAAAFPRLRYGLRARRLLREGNPGSVHGVIDPRKDELDPRRNTDLVLSASALEHLGTCPLRYLHRSILKLYLPDDPELDPERWLDPRQRGVLLHQVFERILSRARDQVLEFENSAFEKLAFETLEEAVLQMRTEVPVPGKGALKRDTSGLISDVRSFVHTVRKSGVRWIALEKIFGLDGSDPVVMKLPGGQLRLRGKIDRVDEDLEGMRVIDYKTGVVSGFSETGTFSGGRRLQIALYAYAAESLFNSDIVSGEYHFSTTRGQNQVFDFNRETLAQVDELVDMMLNGVGEGSFIPTEDAADCKSCDYRDICRVTEGYKKVVSPLTEWSKEQMSIGSSAAFDSLKRVRAL